MKKNLFCANEQVDMVHTFTIEGNEIITRCDSCKRMVKFPGDATKEQLVTLMEQHRSANQGHIPAPTPEAVDAQLSRLEELLVG